MLDVSIVAATSTAAAAATASLLSNQFFVIPICLVTFLQLWFSSSLLSLSLLSSPLIPVQFYQYFPIIFCSCVCVCVCVCVVHLSDRLKHSGFEWKVELISSEKSKEGKCRERREREWVSEWGSRRRREVGGWVERCWWKQKNVNFSSRDFENVMVMPLWIESSVH